MNRRVFAWSLRQAGRTLLVLFVAAALFHFLVLLAASAFLGEASVRLFGNPPRVFEAFLGGTANLLEPEGWMATALTHPLAVALMVGAGNAVALGAVAAEVERGSIDFVLGRPVGRRPYLLAKGAAAAVAVAVAELGGLVGVLVARLTVERMGEIGLGTILGSFALSFLLYAALAMVTLLVSAGESLRSRAVALAVGVVVGWYFANFVALLIDGTSWLRFASPFHYFRPSEVIAGRWAATDAPVLAALGGAALAAAVWRFSRRDLTR
ncbi:MAG: ABC transporter permease subunit [Actinobacteria bacterium]|nr:ABC transporter permease subunit [Actinomycetota bacterium]